MRRARWAARAVALLVVSVLASCSCEPGGRGADRADRAGPSGRPGWCQLLEVPRKTLGEHGLTVEEALTLPGEQGLGIRAMFAFLQVGEASGSERFRPALGYLSERWEAESISGVSNPAAPTEAVRANARELDRFLADGGCD